MQRDLECLNICLRFEQGRSQMQDVRGVQLARLHTLNDKLSEAASCCIEESVNT